MNYLEFTKSLPILFGNIRMKNKIKFGMFKPGWNRYSNTLCYQYHTLTGNKGEGGFTLKTAFSLFVNKKLRLSQNDFVL